MVIVIYINQIGPLVAILVNGQSPCVWGVKITLYH